MFTSESFFSDKLVKAHSKKLEIASITRPLSIVYLVFFGVVLCVVKPIVSNRRHNQYLSVASWKWRATEQKRIKRNCSAHCSHQSFCLATFQCTQKFIVRNISCCESILPTVFYFYCIMTRTCLNW